MKKYILYIGIMLAAAAIAINASAQGKFQISGTVSDEGGNPVPGAVVMLEGSPDNAAVTGADGKYALRIPSQAGILKVQCLGYADQSRELGSAGVYDFVLNDDAQMLESVEATLQARLPVSRWKMRSWTTLPPWTRCSRAVRPECTS